MEDWIILIIGLLIVPFTFWIDKRDSNSTYYKEHPERRKKPYHKRWWVYLIAVFLVGGAISEITDPPKHHSHRLASDKEMRKEYKKTVRDRINSETQNLPGQKINKSKANKHEFYWTSKDDKKVRYFVTDGKITAMKVVLTPDVNNTFWCKAYLANVLHDNHLQFTNDRLADSAANLSNKGRYNIYSPKVKKWYNVSFSPADNVGKKDNMVATFSVYPGKSSDAE